MSDTPETDAQLTTFTSISKLKRHFVNRTGTVSADFARKLERERDEARDTVLRLRKQRAIARNFGEQMERERDEAVSSAASLLHDWRICNFVAAELEFKYEKARERLRRKKK